MTVVSDRGILLFDRAYGGWGDSALLIVPFALDAPALLLSELWVSSADFELPWSEHQLSVLRGCLILLFGAAEWVLAAHVVMTRRSWRRLPSG